MRFFGHYIKAKQYMMTLLTLREIELCSYPVFSPKKVAYVILCLDVIAIARADKSCFESYFVFGSA